MYATAVFNTIRVVTKMFLSFATKYYFFGQKLRIRHKPFRYPFERKPVTCIEFNFRGFLPPKPLSNYACSKNTYVCEYSMTSTERF